ncbi:MAG TPA: DNRLRE domain-containing protein, partial [Kineosporiaceae bacterium]|nr:DNRLRE domain-containing protein [Kineosporiaceae bacterium]
MSGAEVQAASAAVKPRAVQMVASRPDLVSARVTARAQGKRVEVEALRSETSTTWVNPDGTVTTQAHAGQVRFKDGNGAWRDVKLDLGDDTDGSLTPSASGHGLHLWGPGKAKSGPGKDGSSEAVKADAGNGGAVSLSWPGALPAPVVSGASASYADVAPGVGLRVQALRNGFESFFTLASRPSKPVSWALPLGLTGVTPQADKDGGVSFLDARQTVVSRFLPARAWDSAVDKSGNPKTASPVALSASKNAAGQWQLTVTPDRAWLDDAARVYPVTVDPAYVQVQVAPSFDTYVASNVGTDLSSAAVLQAGSPDGTVQTRSFLSFPLTSMLGKSVVSASLSLQETGSGSCTPTSVEVWDAGAASTTTTWAAQPTIGTSQGSLSAAAGFSASCPAARVNIPITNLVKTWAAGTATTGSLMVRATNETDPAAFKTFAS